MSDLARKRADPDRLRCSAAPQRVAARPPRAERGWDGAPHVLITSMRPSYFDAKARFANATTSGFFTPRSTASAAISHESFFFSWP